MAHRSRTGQRKRHGCTGSSAFPYVPRTGQRRAEGSMRKFQQVALVFAAAGGLSAIGVGSSSAVAPVAYNGAAPPPIGQPDTAHASSSSQAVARSYSTPTQPQGMSLPQPSEVSPQVNPQLNPLISPRSPRRRPRCRAARWTRTTSSARPRSAARRTCSTRISPLPYSPARRPTASAAPRPTTRRTPSPTRSIKAFAAKPFDGS